MSKQYPIIMLGTDAALLDSTSDAALRMKQYGTLYSEIHILISAVDAQCRTVVQFSENVSVYPSNHANKLRAFVWMYRRARALMKEREIRCVMSQDPSAFGLLAWLLTRKGRGIFAVGIYGTDPSNAFFRFESIKHRFYALLSRFVLPRATAIQTDGPETVDRLKEKYGTKVFFKPMLPNNIGVLAARQRVPSQDPLKVLFIGRFVPQKNIPLLVDAIEATRRAIGDGARFTIVGTGPEHNRFKHEIFSRGLTDVCDIRGTVSREEVADLVLDHDVLLMVSRYEGFPRTFMEAAAAGLPIITTDVGGIRDLIIDGETGYVVAQGTSAHEIAERITALAHNRHLLASFSSAIKERWQALYADKTVLDYQWPLVDFLGIRLPS